MLVSEQREGEGPVANVCWTGRGYLTAIILLVVFGGFGILSPFHGHVTESLGLYWGGAALIAAVPNWLVGRRMNVRARAFALATPGARKLFYRARHRFLGVPMELWSVPLVLGGIAVISYALTF